VGTDTLPVNTVPLLLSGFYQPATSKNFDGAAFLIAWELLSRGVITSCDIIYSFLKAHPFLLQWPQP